MKRNFELRSDLVRPKKALGQHFLTDLSVAQKIADALVVELETIGGAVPVNILTFKQILAQHSHSRPDFQHRHCRIGIAGKAVLLYVLEGLLT